MRIGQFWVSWSPRLSSLHPSQKPLPQALIVLPVHDSGWLKPLHSALASEFVKVVAAQSVSAGRKHIGHFRDSAAHRALDTRNRGDDLTQGFVQAVEFRVGLADMPANPVIESQQTA